MSSIWPGSRPDNQLAVKRWRYLTIGFLATAWLVANLIPFFGAFQDILGSLLAAPVLFFFPPFFYLRALAAHGDSVSRTELIACRFMMFVVCPSLVVFGFTSSLKGLIEKWETYGLPFTCHPSASHGE
jgi:amino acid permease